MQSVCKVIEFVMDWDGPTTKKHIAEAQAQGCVLLGPGKDCHYRTYRLPCGHKKECATSSMRNSLPICPTCINAKLKKEAEARGCELLGAGSNYQRRTYRLPCGHEREVATGAMRKGNFRCETCFQNKLEKEAEAQNCKLLGGGKNCNLRTYRLPCGHELEVATSAIRKGEFGCQTCINERLRDEAEAHDCQLLGAGRNRNLRTYLLPCGHEQQVRPGHILTDSFRCQICLENKFNLEAEAQRCELLGPGRTCQYRTYRLPCGHERQLTTAMIRKGSFRCRTCLDNKLKAEAEARGCELLGAGSNKDYRTYLLGCGHEQEMQVVVMRAGTFRCQICEDYWITQPSQAYLLHIKAGADEWLKLGYAKDVDFRTTRYGLPSEAEVSVLATRPFDTGKEAREFEGALHKRYRRKRLRAKDMTVFHSSGATECYPLTMVDKLMSEMKADSK